MLIDSQKAQIEDITDNDINIHSCSLALTLQESDTLDTDIVKYSMNNKYNNDSSMTNFLFNLGNDLTKLRTLKDPSISLNDVDKMDKVQQATINIPKIHDFNQWLKQHSFLTNDLEKVYKCAISEYRYAIHAIKLIIVELIKNHMNNNNTTYKIMTNYCNIAYDMVQFLIGNVTLNQLCSATKLSLHNFDLTNDYKYKNQFKIPYGTVLPWEIRNLNSDFKGLFYNLKVDNFKNVKKLLDSPVGLSTIFYGL